MSDESLPRVGDDSGPVEPLNAMEGRYTPHQLESLREVTTMALYVSLSLIAVLVALPNPTSEDNRLQEGFTVLITGLALVLCARDDPVHGFG